jgi:hypothetical protein
MVQRHEIRTVPGLLFAPFQTFDRSATHQFMSVRRFTTFYTETPCNISKSAFVAIRTLFCLCASSLRGMLIANSTKLMCRCFLNWSFQIHRLLATLTGVVTHMHINKKLIGLQPITVTARSKAWTDFARSNTGIVSSNPT